MTHVTRRLTAKDRDQLRNPTLGNRVWATFFSDAVWQFLQPVSPFPQTRRPVAPLPVLVVPFRRPITEYFAGARLTTNERHSLPRVYEYKCNAVCRRRPSLYRRAATELNPTFGFIHRDRPSLVESLECCEKSPTALAGKVVRSVVSVRPLSPFPFPFLNQLTSDLDFLRA